MFTHDSDPQAEKEIQTENIFTENWKSTGVNAPEKKKKKMEKFLYRIQILILIVRKPLMKFIDMN